MIFRRPAPSRREFFRTSAAALGGFAVMRPLHGLERAARVASSLPGASESRRTTVDLTVSRASFRVGDRVGSAVTVNGTVPGPVLRFREGDTAVIRVRNDLKEDTSIHWHGIILPNVMDGVPGVTYPGIPAGTMFTYEFPITQAGTYWYHSHSGFQEQLGMYGALVIDPRDPPAPPHDREFVIVLSDWTFEDPHAVFGRLKKQGGYYNFQRRTVLDFLRGDGGLRERLMWSRMRMDPTDIADVTGNTYAYLMNGLPPQSAWFGQVRPGERVRLRLINAGAATYFDVRIPGLTMTVVQADGQDVEPVAVDELRVAIAETYDVIVQPSDDRAYTIFAEAMDRSGFAAGTLAPRSGMVAPVPERRQRPVRTMVDMGMDMRPATADGVAADGEHAEHAGHMMAAAPLASAVAHGADAHGAGNAMVPEVTYARLDDPGVGLGDDGRRVLVYRDLRSVRASLHGGHPPERDIELHLTGNMERYMWSFDGKRYTEAPAPVPIRLGERVRLTFVNDTMMEHPIHLHGMWMELENGHGDRQPLKHTLNVKPAERVSVIATPDVPGAWALHCHILYHMDAGMFRVVRVPGEAGATS